MRTIDDWFGDWLIDHRERHPWVNLPDPLTRAGDVHYEGWEEDLRALGITESEATEASKRLQSVDHLPGQHWPEFLKMARQKVRARPTPAAAAPSRGEVDREAELERWAAMPEPEREEVRNAVRARYPELAGSRAFVEAMARGWAANPEWVPGPRPEVSAAAPTSPPRRVRPWGTGKIEANVPEVAAR